MRCGFRSGLTRCSSVAQTPSRTTLIAGASWSATTSIAGFFLGREAAVGLRRQGYLTSWSVHFEGRRTSQTSVLRERADVRSRRTRAELTGMAARLAWSGPAPRKISPVAQVCPLQTLCPPVIQDLHGECG